MNLEWFNDERIVSILTAVIGFGGILAILLLLVVAGS